MTREQLNYALELKNRIEVCKRGLDEILNQLQNYDYGKLELMKNSGSSKIGNSILLTTAEVSSILVDRKRKKEEAYKKALKEFEEYKP
jgi:hypothetical protein